MPTAVPTRTPSKFTPLITIVNREHWLQNCGDVIAPHIESIAARSIPPFLISVSMPTRKGLSLTKRTIGQCFPLAKEGKKSHLFIHPMLHRIEDVSATVAHELIHTLEVGHGKAFGAIALPLGLQKPLTATTPSDAFFEQTDKRGRTLRSLLEKLGPYPHEALDISKRTPQATLLLKAKCTKCSMIFRVTAKYVKAPGLPKCLCGGQFKLAPKKKKVR